jgi:cyanophycin synthetase
MAAATSANVVYFGRDPRQHVLAAHLAAGGRGVFVDHGAIKLADDQANVDLIELERIGFTLGGKIAFQVQNALAAAASAWAADLNPALIARALTTFQADWKMAPGRFNVTEAGGVQIVMDYGHNAAAMAALGEAVQALGDHRTVMLLALPGDRPDADLRAAVEATVAYADEYVLYELHDRRERRRGEMPRLLRSCLPEHIQCTMARDQAEALRKGWRRVRPGDRLILIIDEVDEALELIEELMEASAEDAICDAPIERERVTGR